MKYECLIYTAIMYDTSMYSYVCMYVCSIYIFILVYNL